MAKKTAAASKASKTDRSEARSTSPLPQPPEPTVPATAEPIVGKVAHPTEKTTRRSLTESVGRREPGEPGVAHESARPLV
jgi:hypothetical protein